MSRNEDPYNGLEDEIHSELDNPSWWASEPKSKAARNAEFFHGTGRRLSPGDHILPWQRLKEMGVVEGEAPHGGSHLAWASKHLPEASSYGKNVYKVRPLGEHSVLDDGRVISEHGYEVINDWWKD